MKTIFLIRIALILGVTLFAGLTLFLRSRGSLPEPTAELTGTLQTFRYIVWGLSAFAVAWAFFWKTRAEAAMTEQGVHSALIIGWAPGEAAALFGVVTHFQGGPVATMAFGLLAFIVVLLILRIPTLPK